jgi:phosphohistidine phosphatase
MLMRHAHTTDKLAQQSDRERTLTALGYSQIEKVALALQATSFSPDGIYGSPAVRTQQTAQQLIHLLWPDQKVILWEEIYSASLDTLMEKLQQLPNVQHHVMMVGHNPVISFLAASLSRQEVPHFTPAALVILNFAGDWKDIGPNTCTLHFQLTP